MENQKQIRAPANRGMNQQNSYYSNKSRDYKKNHKERYIHQTKTHYQQGLTNI